MAFRASPKLLASIAPRARVHPGDLMGVVENRWVQARVNHHNLMYKKFKVSENVGDIAFYAILIPTIIYFAAETKDTPNVQLSESFIAPGVLTRQSQNEIVAETDLGKAIREAVDRHVAKKKGNWY